MRYQPLLALLVLGAHLAHAPVVRAGSEESAVIEAAAAASPTIGNAIKLADLLGSSDASIRRQAATALGRFGLSASVAIPALLDLVAVDDAAADAAVDTLGRITGPKTLHEVRIFLRERLARGHDEAAVALLRLGTYDDPVGARVVAAIASGTGDARISAVEALAANWRQVSEGPDAMLRLLDDPDPVVRTISAMKLQFENGMAERVKDLLGPPGPDAPPRLWILWLETMEARAILERDMLPTIAERLSHEDAGVRAAAAAALGSLGPYARDYVQGIARLSADASRWVRFAAVQALVRIGTNSFEVPKALDGFAEDRDEAVRSIVYDWRVRRRSMARGSEQISKNLADGDATVRAAAADAARELEPLPDAHFDALIRLLADGDATVRRTAAEAIGAHSVRDTERAAALAPLLADSDERVREAVSGALVRILSFDPTPYLSLLVDRIREADDPWTLIRLVARGGPAGIDRLLELARHPTWSRRNLGGGILSALASADPEQLDRMDVRRELPRLWVQPDADFGEKGDAGVARLEAVMKREPEFLRDAYLDAQDEQGAERAAELLARWGPEGVKILCEALLEDGRYAAQSASMSLQRMPAEVIWKPVSGLMDRDDPRARSEGIRALDHAKGPWPEEARARAVAALKDREWQVRLAAVDSLHDQTLSQDEVATVASLLSERRAELREQATYMLGGQGRAARGAVPVVLQRIQESKDPRDLASLLCVLGSIGLRSDALVTRALLEALSSPDEGVVSRAVQSIDQLRPEDPRLIVALAKLLDRESLRATAASILGSYGPTAQAAVPALERAAGAASEQVRPAVVAALASVRGGEAEWVSFLVARAQNYPTIRLAEQLGEIGPAASAALPALRKELERTSNWTDPIDRELRAAIEEAIRRIEAPTGK